MTRRNQVPALSHRPFGRRPRPSLAVALPRPSATLSDEARLFALTFAGGFLFMTVYLA